MTTPEAFGQGLQRQCDEQGLTRVELALAVGTTAETVCRWMSGTVLPGVESRRRLKEVLPDIEVPDPLRKERPLLGRKVATTVYLRPSQLDGLRRLAEREGVAVAALLRDAVDEYLERYAGEAEQP